MVDKQFASVNNVPPEPWTGQDTRDRGMRCLIAPHFLALSRFVAAPGESSDRLAAAAAENEVSAEVMQVGKGLLSLWDILVEWHRCCPLHRGINARCYPPPPGVQRTAPRCPTPATDGSRRLPFNRQGRCLPSLYSTNQITAKSVFAITPELQLRQPRTWLSGNTLIALQS